MGKYEILHETTGDFAKVPVEELQDMLDALEGDKIMSQIESGETETFPGDLVFAILAGKNPIKAFRKHRGMTQCDLAGFANLKQPAVARAEKGGTTSVAALKAIADALHVDMDMLIPAE